MRPGVYVGAWGDFWCILASVTKYRTRYIANKLELSSTWVHHEMRRYGGELSNHPDTIIFKDKSKAEACADYLNAEALMMKMKD